MDVFVISSLIIIPSQIKEISNEVSADVQYGVTFEVFFLTICLSKISYDIYEVWVFLTHRTYLIRQYGYQSWADIFPCFFRQSRSPQSQIV